MTKSNGEMVTIGLAEIYDSGVKAGRREVVEWMMGHRTETTSEFICFTMLRVNWQAKREGWGVMNGDSGS